MRALYCIVVLLLSFTFVTGCKACKTYAKDRAYDASDIVTLSVGPGLGVRARTGPVRLGLLCMIDAYGWRYGMHQQMPKGESLMGAINYDWLIGSYDSVFSRKERNKSYQAMGGYPKSWFHHEEAWAIGLPFVESVTYFSTHGKPPFHPYYTQIEACVGVLGAVRVGVNPGELVDFAVGWFTIDIFDDDQLRREPEEDKKGTSDPHQYQ